MICWLSLACHTYTCGCRNLDSNFVLLFFTFWNLSVAVCMPKPKRQKWKSTVQLANNDNTERERKKSTQKIKKIDVITSDIQFNAPSNDCRWFVRRFKFIVIFVFFSSLFIQFWFVLFRFLCFYVDFNFLDITALLLSFVYYLINLKSILFYRKSNRRL